MRMRMACVVYTCKDVMTFVFMSTLLKFHKFIRFMPIHETLNLVICNPHEVPIFLCIKMSRIKLVCVAMIVKFAVQAHIYTSNL